MFYTIYQITDTTNGFIYIGKHQTKKLEDGYMGSGKRLVYAVNKRGLDKFTKSILFVFDTESEMNLKEAEIVTPEFLKRPDVYNLCEGGKGGWGYLNDSSPEHIERTRRGIIKSNKIWEEKYGKNHNSEMGKVGGTKAKEMQVGLFDPKYKEMKSIWSGNAFRGKHLTEEHKRAIGKHNSIAQQGKNNSQYGTCWITNGKENKKIKNTDLDKWIKLNYIKGRI